ncbi:prominin-2 [Ahaetulla prasina]|uniref:prominin-2 n=1 Tax=Ahaetulla prasina TaxID=499056 RepID=UPI002648C3F8|nr:prominin-2 [Ahaetulla prasina]
MGHVLLFFLAFAFVHRDLVNSQQCSSEGNHLLALQFADVGADQRIPAQHQPPGPLDPLYRLVHSYLDVVQQNPFPTELLKDVLNEPPTATTSQILRYQAGYVVCAAIAVLYFVTVPLVGLSLCCFQKNRRCGGRIKAYRRSLLCQRNLLMVCLLFTTLIILGCVICAFAANQKVKEEVDPGARDTLNTLRTLRNHLNGIPRGLRLTVEQFKVPQRQILGDLNSISWNIGSTIHFLLKETVSSAMAAIKGRVQDLENSLHHLRTVHRTVQALIRDQDELASALKDQKRSLTSLLEEPRCNYCTGALSRAQDLKLGADFQNVPSVERVLKNLHGLPQTNFSQMIHKANSSFNAIPQFTVLKMDKVLQELKKDIEGAAQKIQLVADDFPISDQTRPMSEALAKAENVSRPFLKEVKRFETYRWIVGTIACTVILLIVFCNVLGLSFGTYGLVVRDDPSDYEIRAEAGAKFLITGITFSFLFSWILIVLVAGTFLIGGNIQTLVCKPWINQEIYRFIDTPGNLPPSMNVSQYLGLKQNLNLTSAYQQCKNGAGLWEVLQLKDQYSLSEHLNVAKYTAEFQERLRAINLPFEEIVLLTAEGRQDLETFRKSQVDSINYADFTAEMRNPLVRTNVEGLAVDLERLRDVQSDRTLAERLVEEAQKLRRIQNQVVLPMETLLAQLRESVQFLATMSPSFQAQFNNTESQIILVEAILPSQTKKILRQELDCFARKELGFISQYLNWMRSTLTEDVASCQPFSIALDNSRVILCNRVMDPWNAFWFSLGGCAFFLLPGLFLAFKMMKHFRPIRHKLVSTGSDETFPFHIPRVTSLRL